jgi:hypothetical protein
VAALLLPLLAVLVQAAPAAAQLNLSVGTKSSTWNETVGPARILHVVGEVSNSPTGDRARFVHVTCRLYLGTTLLATETVPTEADILLPGELSPFDDIFLVPPAAFDRYSCAVTASSTTTVANHNMTSTVTNVYTDSQNRQHVSGTVVNNNASVDPQVKVMLTFYDSAGKVLDEGSVSLPGALQPGLANALAFDLTRNSPPWNGVKYAIFAEALSPAVSLPAGLIFADQVSGTTSAPQTMAVSNVGTADLHLPANAFKTAGTDPNNFGFTSDNCSGKTVGPGNACTVGVTFTPSDVRQFSARVTVASDANGTPHSTPVGGAGLSRPMISAGPTPVSYGSQLVGSNTSAPITVTNTGIGDAYITGLVLSNLADFSLQPGNCFSVVAPAASCILTVSFTPVDSGLRSGTLTVSAADALGPSGHPARNSPAQVQLSGTGTRALVGVGPSKLTFPSTIVGLTTAAQTVTLSSNGTGPLNITSIQVSGPDFVKSTTCGSSLAPTQQCVVNITFQPTSPAGKVATLTITDNAIDSPQKVDLAGTGLAPATTSFYFAEGFTGTGFTETLSILTPLNPGTATIDYSTEAGSLPSIVVNLQAGKVLVQNVNADVGANHTVSAKVTLSVPGVVERSVHFDNGVWRGSAGIVGVNRTALEWDFAEGSTLPIFQEFLAIQNPNTDPVTVDLNYFTDTGLHPVKTTVLPPKARTTVIVFLGDVIDNPTCDPLVNCGVGPGLIGVSVQVKSRSLPIVAERPFYVLNYSFGSGPIRDGHVAFGANAPQNQWYFAEGTTLGGFNEYLTLQPPGTTDANVTLKYIHDLGTPQKNLVVKAQSRATVLVFDANHDGVGAGFVGMSVQVSSDQPIVAERPMYIYFDFGSGPVAGATVVVGATGLAKLFGFAEASTMAGNFDYLTIQNTNTTTANVTIDYYTTAPKKTKVIAVPASTRKTVLVFLDSEGVGPGSYPLGIVLSSDQPILVEKPTYSTDPLTYGATDTLGYSPGSFALS